MERTSVQDSMLGREKKNLLAESAQEARDGRRPP
jgi:hypothetical protein